MPGRIAVAHFRTPYLSATETFIYAYLSRLGRRIRPILFTSQLENLDRFPFSPIVDVSFRKYSPGWFLNGVGNRLLDTRSSYVLFQLKKRGVRILHAHFGPQGWDLLEIKRRTGLPLITTFYGYDLAQPARDPAWVSRYADLFRDGDLFFVEGGRMKETLAGLGCPRSKIEVQRIAIDTAAIPFEAKRRINGKTIFLFCGRLVEKKGVAFALGAMEGLLKEGRRHFEFRVIGDGPLREVLTSEVRQRGLEDHVVFLGSKTHCEFHEELRRAHIFVSPSVTASNGDTEGGAPTTILEAQAAGLPVVSTVHADIPEVVVPGRSALLAPERDAPALTRHLAYMMDNPGLWGEFGLAGRSHVESQHDINREVARLENRYVNLIEGNLPVREVAFA